MGVYEIDYTPRILKNATLPKLIHFFDFSRYINLLFFKIRYQGQFRSLLVKRILRLSKVFPQILSVVFLFNLAGLVLLVLYHLSQFNFRYIGYIVSLHQLAGT